MAKALIQSVKDCVHRPARPVECGHCEQGTRYAQVEPFHPGGEHRAHPVGRFRAGGCRLLARASGQVAGPQMAPQMMAPQMAQMMPPAAFPTGSSAAGRSIPSGWGRSSAFPTGRLTASPTPAPAAAGSAIMTTPIWSTAPAACVDVRGGLDWDQYGEQWDMVNGIPAYRGAREWRPGERDYAWHANAQGMQYGYPTGAPMMMPMPMPAYGYGQFMGRLRLWRRRRRLPDRRRRRLVRRLLYRRDHRGICTSRPRPGAAGRSAAPLRCGVRPPGERG